MRKLILQVDTELQKEQKKRTFDQMRDAAGIPSGYVELISVSVNDEPHYILCDEEGKMKNKKANFIASRMSGKIIVGNVYVCPAGDVE